MKNTFANQTTTELKNTIKDWSTSTGESLPKGMWKMTKAQLIEFLEDLYADILEDEIVEEVVEEEVVEEVKTEEVKVKKEVKKGKRNKVIIITLLDGTELEINGSGKFHQYMRDNFPEYDSWSMLSSVLKGEDNKKVDKFKASGLVIRYAEGYSHGHANQFNKDSFGK